MPLSEGRTASGDRWRLCAVSQDIMTWSERADLRLVIWLMRRWLFVNRRSRVLEPPVGVGLVPKLIFWLRL